MDVAMQARGLGLNLPADVAYESLHARRHSQSSFGLGKETKQQGFANVTPNHAIATPGCGE
jgi:hypothetical protein